MSNAKSTSSGVRALLRSRVFYTLAAVGGVVAAWTGWNAHLNAPPHFDIPAAAPVPSPNAYEEFVRIANRNVEPNLELWSPAATSTHPPGSPPSSTTQASPAHPHTDAERRAALAKAEPAIQAIRFALTQPTAFRWPPQRSSKVDLAPCAKFRSLARSLNFEARQRTVDGDYAGAVQSGLDAEEFGAIVPTGGAMIQRLVGYAIDAIGRRPLWQLVDQLNADQATVAARRLAAIDAKRPPLAESLTEEKWQTVSMLMTTLHTEPTSKLYEEFAVFMDPPQEHKSWNFFDAFSAFPQPATVNDNQSPEERRAAARQVYRIRMELLRVSKQNIVDETAQEFDDVIARSNRPYSPQRPAANPAKNVISGLLVEPWAAGYSADFRDAEDRVDSRMLTLAFALRAYFVTHGEYPTTLDGLTTTGILRRTPEDPFAPVPNTPFRYHRVDSAHFVLYSVGADAVDNGGRPTDNRRAGMDSRRPIEVTDQGDYVYGINTPVPFPLP